MERRQHDFPTDHGNRMCPTMLVGLLLWLVVTCIVDACLMGRLRFQHGRKAHPREYMVATPNSPPMQEGNTCSGFACAYLLRHDVVQAEGMETYRQMPCKMGDSYVYPKGVTRFLQGHGYRVSYCTGNLDALKNEVAQGKPVIVLMRVRKDRNWLHYVPVVGYDKEHIYLAESLDYLVNTDHEQYNRILSTKEFKRLWNTAELKMPFYRNTYFSTEYDRRC